MRTRMSGRRRFRGLHGCLIKYHTVAKQQNTIDINLLGTKNHVSSFSVRRDIKEQTP